MAEGRGEQLHRRGNLREAETVARERVRAVLGYNVHAAGLLGFARHLAKCGRSQSVCRGQESQEARATRRPANRAPRARGFLGAEMGRLAACRSAFTGPKRRAEFSSLDSAERRRK